MFHVSSQVIEILNICPEIDEFNIYTPLIIVKLTLKLGVYCGKKVSEVQFESFKSPL